MLEIEISKTFFKHSIQKKSWKEIYGKKKISTLLLIKIINHQNNQSSRHQSIFIVKRFVFPYFIILSYSTKALISLKLRFIFRSRPYSLFFLFIFQENFYIIYDHMLVFFLFRKILIPFMNTFSFFANI